MTGILIGVLAVLGGLGLYSRLQDIEALKTNNKALEERVERLEKEVKKLKGEEDVNETAENMKPL